MLKKSNPTEPARSKTEEFSDEFLALFCLTHAESLDPELYPNTILRLREITARLHSQGGERIEGCVIEETDDLFVIERRAFDMADPSGWARVTVIIHPEKPTK